MFLSISFWHTDELYYDARRSLFHKLCTKGYYNAYTCGRHIYYILYINLTWNTYNILLHMYSSFNFICYANIKLFRVDALCSSLRSVCQSLLCQYRQSRHLLRTYTVYIYIESINNYDLNSLLKKWAHVLFVETQYTCFLMAICFVYMRISV